MPLWFSALSFSPPPEVRIRASLVEPQDAASPLATPLMDFSVHPSLNPSASLPGNRGPQSIQISVGCFEPSSGNPIPNCSVTLSLTQQAGGGGHIHAFSGNTDRPAGTNGTGSISPASITTGPNGEARIVTYLAPRTTGVVYLRMDYFPPSGTASSRTYTIGMLVPNLVQLARDGFMYTIVNTSNHGLANWFTSDMWSRVEQLPDLYYHEVPIPLPEGTEIPRLFYTGASLEWGGLFFYRGNWSPPHNSHDDGRDLDISEIRDHPEYVLALGRAIDNACVWKQNARGRWVNSCLSQPIRGERTYDPLATHYHVRGAS